MHTRFKKYLLILPLVFVLSLLSGCIHDIPQPAPGDYRSFSAEQLAMVDDIEDAGVIVFKHGDRLMMILPVDRFFKLQSAEIRPPKYMTLVHIANLVNSFGSEGPPKPTKVYVTGHSDHVFTKKGQLIQSRAYARVIAKYLKEFGVPRKLLVVRGVGSKKPIASNSYPAGAAMNRRVVIQIK